METGFALSEIDTTTPHPARMYDALLGGKDNYAADRRAVRELLKAAPEARDSARANRAFLQRAVRFLAGEAGIRQIIDIGTGIPAAGNVHEVAAQAAPGTRVAYVDNNPIVHVHANALLTGSGTTRIVLADLREPEAILTHPKVRALIDFSQPVALLLVAILHFITEREDPARILATIRAALPEGSYLALSHATADIRPAAARHAAAVYDQATSPVTLRTRAQVTALFDGWDMVEPGLVQVPLWRPDGRPPRPKDLDKIWVYGGVARKSPDGTGQAPARAPASGKATSHPPAPRQSSPRTSRAAAPAHPSPPTGKDARQTRITTAEPRPRHHPGPSRPRQRHRARPLDGTSSP